MITISLKGTCPDHKHYTRKILQELFNIYRHGGGDLDNIDNLLCDLYGLEHYMVKLLNMEIKLYWSFHPRMYYTDMNTYFDSWFDNHVEISYNREQHAFLITPVELDKNGQVVPKN